MLIPGNTFQEEHEEEVSHEYFPTCPCEPREGEPPVKMDVPPKYDFYKEREAVTNLFLNIHGMLTYIHRLEIAVNADQDSHCGEPGVRQLSVVPDGDGPVD
jgi:hypothetical protein